MRWNFSSKLTKLLFQADETLVSNRRNFSFKPQKLNVLPIETNQRYYQFKESIKRSCTSLIMVDLFISNSCYVLTRNITNPGSCLLYYLLFLPPVYLFFSYSFNRLTLLFERRKKKGTHPFSSFYPASRAFLVFS